MHFLERSMKISSHCTLLLFLAMAHMGMAEQLTAVRGADFEMVCYSSSNLSPDYVEVKYRSNQPSSPEVVLAHYKPGVEGSEPTIRFFPTKFDGRLSFMPKNSITIKSIQVGDEGMFSCATKEFGKADAVVENNLVVYVRPEMEARRSVEYLSTGDSPINAAYCTAKNAKPEATVVWSTDRHLEYNQEWSTDPGTLAGTTTNTSTLYVAPTKFYNEQTFICTVMHPSFDDGSNITTIRLDVRYPPEPPIIKVTNDNKQLTCSSEGNPEPTIVWILPPSAPVSTYTGAMVALVKPDDPARQNDTYICTASNNIEPSSDTSITTAEASTYVELVNQSNTGVIVAAVVGSILIVVIIVALVYWFVIRKMREKDDGPYNPKKISRHGEESGGDNWARSSGRPTIEHANESLNKNGPPPSPTGPPPPDYDDDDDVSNGSRSDVEEDMEGHDVDLTAPLTQNDDDEDMPTTGIVSKNSVNFQHRRQRPSTSPHRRSQNRGYPEPTPRNAQPEPHYEELQQRSDPRYEVPPQEYYDDGYDDEQPLAGGHEPEEPMDNRFYDRPEDRYPDYQQRYKPPSEVLPPYSKDIQYASLDHDHNGGEPRTRPPYHEPVEYAEIRSRGQIV